MQKSVLLILSFFLLVAFFYLGVWLNSAFALPIPGALSGLVLLFVALLILRDVPKPLLQVSQLLLRHLSLLFIPTTLYIVVLKESFIEHWPILITALLISTFTSMLLAAIVCKRLPIDNGPE